MGSEPQNQKQIFEHPLDRSRYQYDFDTRNHRTIKKRIADLAIWAAQEEESGHNIWPETIEEIIFEFSNFRDALARRKALNMIKAEQRKRDQRKNRVA